MRSASVRDIAMTSLSIAPSSANRNSSAPNVVPAARAGTASAAGDRARTGRMAPGGGRQGRRVVQRHVGHLRARPSSRPAAGRRPGRSPRRHRSRRAGRCRNGPAPRRRRRWSPRSPARRSPSAGPPPGAGPAASCRDTDRARSRSAISTASSQAPRTATAMNSCRAAASIRGESWSGAHGPRPSTVMTLAVTATTRPASVTRAIPYRTASQNSQGQRQVGQRDGDRPEDGDRHPGGQQQEHRPLDRAGGAGPVAVQPPGQHGAGHDEHAEPVAGPEREQAVEHGGPLREVDGQRADERRPRRGRPARRRAGRRRGRGGGSDRGPARTGGAGVAPTRGSAVLARANPQAATGPMPWVRSMATSTSAAVARIHGHRRRSVSTSAERVTPAGRNRTAPVLEDSKSTKDVIDPAAYPAATSEDQPPGHRHARHPGLRTEGLSRACSTRSARADTPCSRRPKVQARSVRYPRPTEAGARRPAAQRPRFRPLSPGYVRGATHEDPTPLRSRPPGRRRTVPAQDDHC